MIEVFDLVYEYPTTRALDGVSLTVKPGTITALVGPNGAGKTTLLRCLAALEMPYSGKVLIDGLDTREKPREIHRRLGYLPDFYGLYDQLSVERCLFFAARANGLSQSRAREAAKKTAERVNLADRMAQRAAELSRGLRQRLAIGQAIAHEPKVLLLDEPAAGLDPQARRDLSKLFLALKEQGMTLLVSSHILAELEDYSAEMIIIDKGKIAGGKAVAVGAAHGLLKLTLSAAKPGLKEALEAEEGVTNVHADEHGATFAFAGDEAGRARIMRGLIGKGFDVSGLTEQKRTMEETYFAEVEKEKEKTP